MVRPHVVRVRQAEVVVKPVLHRQELFVVAKVPFTVDGSGVTLLFTDLSQRRFAGVDAVPGAGPQRAEDANPNVVAAGEQPRPRGAAHGLGHIKVGELAPFLGHAVEVGRGIRLANRMVICYSNVSISRHYQLVPQVVPAIKGELPSDSGLLDGSESTGPPSLLQTNSKQTLFNLFQ